MNEVTGFRVMVRRPWWAPWRPRTEIITLPPFAALGGEIHPIDQDCASDAQV